MTASLRPYSYGPDSQRYRGYDYRFEGGTGGHDGEHGGAILPDTLRWLWRAGSS